MDLSNDEYYSAAFRMDIEKEKINIAKHKLNFIDACHAFSDPFQLNLYDTDHSDNEDRWVIIGEVPVMKIVVVVHTIKVQSDEDGCIRIISARKATKNERESYIARRPL